MVEPGRRPLAKGEQGVKGAEIEKKPREALKKRDGPRKILDRARNICNPARKMLDNASKVYTPARKILE